MNKRPLAVTIVAAVYIAAGALGFAYHFREFNLWVELVRLIAAVCGVFLLLGHNWARWVALAWIGFHVVLSAFHSLSELAVHAIICAVVAYLLFRARSAAYFARVASGSGNVHS